MNNKYNVRFINPFLNAVIDVLGTMAMVQATPEKPYINTKRVSVGDVTGLIGINGHADGVISLSLDEKCILHIVSNMLGEEYSRINEEIIDAVGELTNMIAGQARAHLANEGLKFQASTPTVIVGKNHMLSHVNKEPILAIPFATPHGKLVVEISINYIEQ